MSVITESEDPTALTHKYNYNNYIPKPTKNIIKARKDIQSVYKYINCEITAEEFFYTTQFDEEPYLLYDDSTKMAAVNTYHFFFMFYIESHYNYNKHLYNCFDSYDKMIEYMNPFCFKYKTYCAAETELHHKTSRQINNFVYSNINYIKQFIKARKNGIRAKKEFLLKRKMDMDLVSTKEDRFCHLLIYKIVSDLDENVEEFTNRVIEYELSLKKNKEKAVQQHQQTIAGHKRRRTPSDDDPITETQQQPQQEQPQQEQQQQE